MLAARRVLQQHRVHGSPSHRAPRPHQVMARAHRTAKHWASPGSRRMALVGGVLKDHLVPNKQKTGFCYVLLNQQDYFGWERQMPNYLNISTKKKVLQHEQKYWQGNSNGIATWSARPRFIGPTTNTWFRECIWLNSKDLSQSELQCIAHCCTMIACTCILCTKKKKKKVPEDFWC